MMLLFSLRAQKKIYLKKQYIASYRDSADVLVYSFCYLFFSRFRLSHCLLSLLSTVFLEEIYVIVVSFVLSHKNKP